MNTTKRRSGRKASQHFPCEFCPKVIGGPNTAGLYANYNRHVLGAHPDPWLLPSYNGPWETAK